jgi:predicted unusual protein kinase regulating ubiquinone biosynthesis (AarF/ABC1/UbiB family)
VVDIPTGRWRRARPLLGMARRRRGRRPLDRAQYEQQAARYAEELGHMKGAAMKAGQWLSLVQAMRSVPPEYRGAFGEYLSVLQDDVPPMDPATTASVIAEELGAPPSEVFARFDEQPLAAASLGQVHRATLADGRHVAVKIQYPGVADAVAADLSNVKLFASTMYLGSKILTPNLDVRAVAEELRVRITEELDYRREARNQQDFADFYAGHPFIRIPAVVPELTTGRVLVQDLAEGRRWASARTCDQSLRDQWGEVIVRFFHVGLFQTGLVNADPHPGNYLFHDDGTVTFVDFGCVERYPPEAVALQSELADATLAGDAEQVKELLGRIGLFPPGDKVDARRVLDWYRGAWEPVSAGGEWTYTSEWAAGVVDRWFNPTGPWRDVTRRFAIPRDFLFVNRIVLGQYALVGALEATADWAALDAEIRHGAPPASELGRQHAAWVRRRAGTHP